MEKELDFIMALMNEKIEIETLKTIKQRIDKMKNKQLVETIKENKKINLPAEFMASSKIIKVNYNKMLEYLNKLENAMKIDIPQATLEEIKLIKLLTVYRIFIHEIYHSKQIYSAFDTKQNDIETEITRSLYNINIEKYSKELKTKNRNQIIEEKTVKTNEILFKHSEINPIERKAEIESLKQIKQLITPIKGKYKNVYNELQLIEYSKLIAGYDRAEIPYIKVLEILKKENKEFKIKFPYGCPNKFEFLKTAEDLATEKERLELGLNVSNETTERIYQKIYDMIGY